MNKEQLLEELRISLPNMEMLKLVDNAVVRIDDRLLYLKERDSGLPQTIFTDWDKSRDYNYEPSELEGKSVCFNLEIFGKRGKEAIRKYEDYKIKTLNGHRPYEAEDFLEMTEEEKQISPIYSRVVNDGLNICKVCGLLGEGLNKPCRNSKQERLSNDAWIEVALKNLRRGSTYRLDYKAISRYEFGNTLGIHIYHRPMEVLEYGFTLSEVEKRIEEIVTFLDNHFTNLVKRDWDLKVDGDHYEFTHKTISLSTSEGSKGLLTHSFKNNSITEDVAWLWLANWYLSLKVKDTQGIVRPLN